MRIDDCAVEERALCPGTGSDLLVTLLASEGSGFLHVIASWLAMCFVYIEMKNILVMIIVCLIFYVI